MRRVFLSRNVEGATDARAASGLRSRVIHQERWFTVVELGLPAGRAGAEEAAGPAGAPPPPPPRLAGPVPARTQR